MLTSLPDGHISRLNGEVVQVNINHCQAGLIGFDIFLSKNQILLTLKQQCLLLDIKRELAAKLNNTISQKKLKCHVCIANRAQNDDIVISVALANHAKI